jgi:tetratricopeptide (TPR) repeat protein
LQNIENKELVPNTIYYRLGLSYDLLGQREKAVATYRQMKKVDLSGSTWEYLPYRRGQQRIQKPPDEVDRLLIRAENEATLNHHELAMAIYREILQKHKPDIDQQALAMYGIVQSAYELKRYDEVLEMARRLVSLRPPTERWLIPHGHYRLGQAYARLGRTAEARREFDAVKSFSRYEYQTRLESRVEEELQRLNTASQ